MELEPPHGGRFTEEVPLGDNDDDFAATDDAETTIDNEQAELIMVPEDAPPLEQKLTFRGALSFVTSYFRELERVFGPRFLLLLFLVQFCIKGVVYQVVQRGMFPLMKALNLEAAVVQIYANVAMSPWALKPVLGIASDLLMIRQRSKKYWMLGAIAVGALGATSMSISVSSAGLILVGMTALSFLGSLSDLLTEAKYSELLRENPLSGSRVVVFANGSQRVGYGVACALMIMFGFGIYLPVFLVILVCVLSILLPTIYNFLPESLTEMDERIHRGYRNCFVLVQKFRNDWKIIIVISSLGLLSPITAFLPLLFTGRSGLIAATAIFYGTTVVFLGLSWLVFKSRWITIVALYEVSKRVMRPRMDSALDFFYTASPECVVGGPNLSQFIYVTVACWVSAVTAVLGLVMYQSLFKKWSFRRIVLVTVLVNALGASSDLLVIFRWNLAVGIPDSVAFLLGDAVVQPIVSSSLIIQL